jgi:hypothetical protein
MRVAPLRSSPLLPHISLALMWLPKGLRRSKINSTTAHHRDAGILDLIQTDLLPQISAGIEIRKKSSLTVCV